MSDVTGSPLALGATFQGRYQIVRCIKAGGMGAVYDGIMAIGESATVTDHCDGPACDAEGKAAADSVKSLGLVSTIGFGVGIAGLATAAVLWLTAPGPSSSKPSSARRVLWADVASGSDGATFGVGGCW